MQNSLIFSAKRSMIVLPNTRNSTSFAVSRIDDTGTKMSGRPFRQVSEQGSSNMNLLTFWEIDNVFALTNMIVCEIIDNLMD